MAKQRGPVKKGATTTRAAKRPEKKRKAAPKAAKTLKAVKAVKTAVKTTVKTAVRAAVKSTVKAVKAPAKRAAAERRALPEPRQAPVAAPPPPAAVRKPGFYDAVAVYERGVQALQRHDYQAAAGFFRNVLERYPDERELLERARLYLRVCERETARQPAAPKTPAERVYAATVALNSGDHSGALDHLQRALGEDPDSDHAHYIMAVALGMRGRVDEALEHLRDAIGLNPDNRGLARQDPDLEPVRDHENFRAILDTPPHPNRRRSSSRPRR